MASYKELVKEYRKLAKRADQRLVRIEAASYQKQYEGIKQMAYKNAMRDIAVYSGQGAKRFNTKPPQTKGALERKINDIRQFLNSKSSTVTGVKEINRKRVDTFNKNNGTDFTLTDFKNLMDSGVFDTVMKDYGSDQAIEIIAKTQRDKGQLLKAREEARAKNIQIEQTEAMSRLDYDFVVKGVISDLLAEEGLTLLDLV